MREPGDYAVRGGIIDLFAPGMGEPVRLDFFGDTLESIRSFDPETQRTNAELRALDLVPMAEFQLTSDTIRRSAPAMSRRSAPPAPDDVLYEAVSEGRRYAGMEHWLPLFHKRLETLFDYRRRHASSLLEPLAEEAAHERLAQIADYYEARKEALDQTGQRCALQAAAAGPALSRRSRMARAAGRRSAGAADAVRRARRHARHRSTSARKPATISPPSGASPARTCSRR